MADGSIRVGTKLDMTQLKRDIKEMERELNKVRKEQAKVDAQADQARAFYEAEKEFDAQFPEEFSHREEIDERATQALDKIVKRQEELNEKEQNYVGLLDAAKAKLTELESVGDASKQVDDAVKTDKTFAKIKDQEDYNSLLDATAAKMATIEAAAEQVAEETGLTKEQILNANPAYQKLVDTINVLRARSADFGDEVQGAGDKASTAMVKAEKSTKKVGIGVTGAIAKFGKMALAIFGIRGAYMAVRMAVNEYIATNEELGKQINTMKSLLGQVLGPAIEWVVNLFMKAIAAVNSFVYALTGINIVAKANAAALEKQAKAGSGNQTAGFDEQTKLSQSGGSDGVATLPDGTEIDMSFLDPLKEALQRFANDIAPFISTIKTFGSWLFENFLTPLADWALNGVIPGFLDILGAAFLVLNDALWKLQPIAQWIWDNFLEPIASWTGGIIVDVLNAIGNWIRDHQETLSTVVSIAIALGAALVGIPEIISGVAMVFGALGAALSSPITWITALIALFVTLYDECEGFRKGMDEAWKAITEIFKSSVDFIKALFKGDWAGMDKAWEKIKTAGTDLLKGLYEGVKAGWEWLKEKLSAIWEKITEAFCNFFGIKSPSTLFAKYGKYIMQGLLNGIKDAVTSVVDACKSVWTKIKNVFSSVGSWFKEKFKNAGANIASAFAGAISKIRTACSNVWSAIKGVFSNVTGWFKEKFQAAWTAVKNVFSTGGKIFDGIKDGIASTFKTVVNGLIGGINKIIAVPFNSINGMLNTIRATTIFGYQPFKDLWSYNPLSVPQIPKLALGGIVNRPGRGVPAIIGEAGAEAVLPLENNTEWMDILADKIGGGNVTIPIYLDGKKIYTYMVDIGKRKAFATNGG